MGSIEIRPLSGALGAEIVGVDLRQELDAAQTRAIEQAWFDHLVILFRNQDITIEQQRSFAGKFGPIGVRTRSNRPAPPPEAAQYGADVMLVTNVRSADGKPIGSLPDGEMMFHSDTPYQERPAKATILYGVEVTSTGGETLFGNSYAAAETLPEEIKRKLDGRKAMHVYEAGTTLKAGLYDRSRFPHYAHPVFRKHPGTGRSSLFVSELMTEEIVGMPQEESDRLLAFLFAHQRQDRFIYEHRWTKGDLLMWDNRCTIHARKDFPAKERRMLRRLVVQDEHPVLEGSAPLRLETTT